MCFPQELVYSNYQPYGNWHDQLRKVKGENNGELQGAKPSSHVVNLRNEQRLQQIRPGIQQMNVGKLFSAEAVLEVQHAKGIRGDIQRVNDLFSTLSKPFRTERLKV